MRRLGISDDELAKLISANAQVDELEVWAHPISDETICAFAMGVWANGSCQ